MLYRTCGYLPSSPHDDDGKYLFANYSAARRIQSVSGQAGQTDCYENRKVLSMLGFFKETGF